MAREPKWIIIIIIIIIISSNQKVGTNLDFKLSKSNDHGSYTSPSMTEHNDDCNVGAANLPSAEEHE